MAFNREEWIPPLPYGKFGLGVAVLDFFSFLFFMLAAFRCYFSVDKNDDYKIFIGYWSAENAEIAKSAGRKNDNNYCVSWTKEARRDFFDGAWRFGRFLGIFGALISIPLFLFGLYILFYRVEPLFFKIVAGAKASMAVMSLLLLVGLSSDLCAAFSCKLGPGGHLAIWDFFLWVGGTYCAVRLLGNKEENVDFNKSGNIESESEMLALPPSTTQQNTLSNKI